MCSSCVRHRPSRTNSNTWRNAPSHRHCKPFNLGSIGPRVFANPNESPRNASFNMGRRSNRLISQAHTAGSSWLCRFDTSARPPNFDSPFRDFISARKIGSSWKCLGFPNASPPKEPRQRSSQSNQTRPFSIKAIDDLWQTKQARPIAGPVGICVREMHHTSDDSHSGRESPREIGIPVVHGAAGVIPRCSVGVVGKAIMPVE